MSKMTLIVATATWIVGIAVGVLSGFFLGCSMYQLDSRISAPGTSADAAVTIARLVAQEEFNKVSERMAALDRGLASRFSALDQRLNSIAQNHNGLVKGLAQEQRGDRTRFLLMEKAIRRLHTKSDWIAALSGANAELVDEAKALAETARKPVASEPLTNDTVEVEAPAAEGDEAEHADGE